MAKTEKETIHVLIGNIPEKLHSADLRAFFSQFIESRGFICFHYRHRPENKLFPSIHSITNMTENIDDNPERQPSNQGQDAKNLATNARKVNHSETKCCVTIMEKSKFLSFMRCYRKKIWTDKEGNYLNSRIFISPIKINDSSNETVLVDNNNNLNQISKNRLTTDDFVKLPELNPPPVMPNGNVGTPLSVFMDLIRTCRFPPRMISKLNLDFPKNRSSRKYGALGYNYSEKEAIDLRGKQAVTIDTNSKRDSNEQTPSDDDEMHNEWQNVDDDHDPDVEEWDRYEAIFDDVDKQGRTKERLFEDEIELKWEKGGSGLVFYTDANYWKEQEGDFDEQTVDDWDVDFSGYYERDGGDKDVGDIIQMRIEKRRRDGIEDTPLETDGNIGEFERHTKGFGGRILKSQGWKKGTGIGRIQDSITEPIQTNGQNPRCKSGIGYYGEKLDRNVKKSRTDRNTISTIYDNIEEEPKDTAYRSAGPDTLKYRFVNFVSASDKSNS